MKICRSVIPMFGFCWLLIGCGDSNPPTNFLTEESSSDVVIAIDDSKGGIKSSEKSQVSEDEGSEILDQLYTDNSAENKSESDKGNSNIESSDAIGSASSNSEAGSENGYDINKSSNAAAQSSGVKKTSGTGQETVASVGDEEFDALTSEELTACAKTHGVSSKYVKVVNQKGSLTLSSNSIIAFKIRGNKSNVSVDLVNAKQVKIPGICLFLSGNQSQFSARLNNVIVDRMVYIGRGNQSYSKIQVDANAQIVSALVSLKGNSARLDIVGSGKYSCENMKLNTKSSGLKCN